MLNNREIGCNHLYLDSNCSIFSNVAVGMISRALGYDLKIAYFNLKKNSFVLIDFFYKFHLENLDFLSYDSFVLDSLDKYDLVILDNFDFDYLNK